MAGVLIVDDEKNNVDILSLIVSQAGCEPIVAYNGKQALNAIVANQPDLIFLDFMMPGIDGIETLRCIRALPEGKLLPVFIITASNDKWAEEQAMAAGATGFLSKPLDLNTLLTLIEEHAHKEGVIIDAARLLT